MIKRFYSKGELAQAYFPSLQKKSSTTQLWRWIRRCAPLYARLLETGYNPYDRAFSVRQTELIFEYLGEP